jgi:predicted aconitase
MHLTDDEKRMLAGDEGEAARLAMALLSKMGTVHGAERMVPVRSVHAACVYPQFKASVEMMERFAELGGVFRAVTTANPILNPENMDRWEDLPESEALRRFALRQIRAIRRMGVIPTWSCTPYFQGNLPRRGEPISWVESSAIIFANSVLGARTNRTTMGVDIASAITGRVPEFGLLLDEERSGNALVRVECQAKSLFDYDKIGFLIGKALSGKVPVIEGLPGCTTANQLKVMGAAAATKGGIALYHVVGITPEAPTREEAFRGRRPEIELRIREKDLEAAAEELSTCGKTGIDAVLLGCPHPTVVEIRDLARALIGKKIREDTKFCLFAAGDTLNWARRMGHVELLEAAGVRIFEGDCIVFHSTRQWGWVNAATNSVKYACSLPSNPTYLNVLYTDTRGCVDLATA